MITPQMLQAQRDELRSTPAAPRPVKNGTPASTPWASRRQGVARLEPADRDATEAAVDFDYNPAAITISHTAQVATSNANSKTGETKADANVSLAANSVEERERARGTTSITLRSLTFDGKHVARTCLRLLAWSHSVRVPGDPQATALPELKFVWGPQIYLVHLNQVTATYTRFGWDGLPVRATVDLTLHSVPSLPGPTNPSSGGPSGRRTHLLAGTESLPELATRTYGGPGHWREIAAANRFEDPLRVRPGTLVYLPGAQEDGR
ncbi:hypothetical protein ACIGXM_25900 [Kitasatospora sp. NPDC052896]|uniref:CIS tube protein n=1 Tax=Kitasatospora sp. NPDC052896 TaxID=3364061 RepID=UPI0037CA6A15